MADGLTPEPSETRLRQIVITLVMILLPPILLFTYYRMMIGNRGLMNADAMDYAQVGRNLMQGHGWSTYILRPLNIDLGIDPTRQPDLTHGPLFPLFLALAFAPFGVKDSVPIGVSGLFYLATVPILYLLGTRVFNRTVGLVAALIFAVSHSMLEYATSGLPITLFTFLMTALLLVIYNIAADARNTSPATQNRAPRGQLILAGVLMGALYLTEPMLALVVPIAFGLIIWSSPRNRGAAVLFTGIPLLLLVGPWMFRNAMLTGNPVYGGRGLEVWMNTSVYPNFSIYRMFRGEVVPSAELFRAIVQKFQGGLGAFIESAPAIPLAWVLAFFLPALLIRYADPATLVLRRTLSVGFLLVVLTNLLFTPYATLYVAFVPVMLVFALSLIAILMQQAHIERGPLIATYGLLGFVIILPLFNTLTIGLRNRAPVNPQRRIAAFFSNVVVAKPDDVVVSDQPWLVAWYGARPSLWLPQSDTRFIEAKQKFGKRMRYLMLTEQTNSSNIYPPSWALLHTLGAQWNDAVMRWYRDIRPVRKDTSAPPPLQFGQVAAALRANKVTTPFRLSEPLKNFRTFLTDPGDRANVGTVLAVDQTTMPAAKPPARSASGARGTAAPAR